jgi:hypothetical protein
MAKKKSAAAPKARLMTITPSMAEEWLKYSLDNSDVVRNRPVSDSVVESYVKEIEKGAWVLNGETIKLTEDGIVLDGQHRLWAIVYADKPITTWVVKGVDAKAFATIDRGSKRTVGNILAITGESDTNVLAASLNHLFRYRNRTMERSVTRNSQTAQEAMDLLEREPELKDSPVPVRAWFKATGVMPLSAAVFLHYILSQKHPRIADEFMEKLGTGIDLSRGDPVRILREKLLLRRTSPRHRLNTKEMLALAFKAWKIRLAGKAITKSSQLVWRSKSSPTKAAEEFPYLERAPKAKASTKKATKKPAKKKAAPKKGAKKKKK